MGGTVRRVRCYERGNMALKVFCSGILRGLAPLTSVAGKGNRGTLQEMYGVPRRNYRSSEI